MKKLIALTLVLCLLCGCCVSALAETGYVTIYQLLTDTSGEYEFALGKPDGNIEGDPGDFLMLWYDSEDQEIMLVGRDANNSTRIVWWDNIDFAKGLTTIYAFCGVYSDIAALVSSDQTLVFGVTGGDDPIYVTSASDAETFCKVVQDFLNK